MSERTEKMKQKQWVQIAAVFFGLMIVLTICSRAASSAVKARVTVTRASRQKISHEISLNGSVEAKNYVLQYVTSGLMVTGVQVSPGQQVEAGDVIFTVDMQKLQESIASIETELNRVDEKERLSVSRAEAAYQDVKANAEEEKARAYQTYEKAVAEYQNYINTHKKTAGVSAESTEERTMNEKAASVYDETVAKELENAVESEKSAYAAVVREQEKQISAAADAVQRTKEDLNLSQDTDTLEEQLKKLQKEEAEEKRKEEEKNFRNKLEKQKELLLDKINLLPDNEKFEAFLEALPYGVYCHNSVEAKAVLEIYNEKFMNVDVSASKKLACKSYSFFVECYEYGLITKEELVEYITNFKEEPENE